MHFGPIAICRWLEMKDNNSCIPFARTREIALGRYLSRQTAVPEWKAEESTRDKTTRRSACIISSVRFLRHFLADSKCDSSPEKRIHLRRPFGLGFAFRWQRGVERIGKKRIRQSRSPKHLPSYTRFNTKSRGLLWTDRYDR